MSDFKAKMHQIRFRWGSGQISCSLNSKGKSGPKPSCNRYGSREWNGTECHRGRAGVGGQHQNFLLEFARFTQVVLPTSEGRRRR